MTQRIITEDNFKRHIKSAQSERAITDLLFSELSDENVNPGGHAIKSHYKAVQQLAQKMAYLLIQTSPLYNLESLHPSCLWWKTHSNSAGNPTNTYYPNPFISIHHPGSSD